MKKMVALALVALSLSACASSAPSSRVSAMNWDTINTSQVAQVSNIKSLISPGVY